MELELRSVDIVEKRKVVKFSEKTCGCQLFNGHPCSRAFPVQHIEDVRNQCLALERSALDFILLGQIMAHTRTSEMVAQPPKKRKRENVPFFQNCIKVHMLIGYVLLIIMKPD